MSMKLYHQIRETVDSKYLTNVVLYKIRDREIVCHILIDQRMIKLLYLVVLSVSLLEFVQGGRFSIGVCPPIQTQVDFETLQGSWHSLIETKSTDDCTSYIITGCLKALGQCVIRKTSSRQPGVYDSDYGVLLFREGSPKFFWPGSLDGKTGNVFVYNENLIGLFFCKNLGLLIEKQVVLLSKTNEIDSFGVEQFAVSLIDFGMSAYDLIFVSHNSCPEVLVMPGTTTTETPATPPTIRIRFNVAWPPQTTTEKPVPANPRVAIDIPWLKGPGVSVVPVTTTTQIPITTTTEETISRGRGTFDIPWLAGPGVSVLPHTTTTTRTTEAPRPVTRNTPATTTTSTTRRPTTRRPTPTTSTTTRPTSKTPTTPEWTTIAFIDAISHEADTRSEEASRELEF